MKISQDSTLSMLPPFRAREIHASVALIAPLADGLEVQERITQETVADMQRYILLADKLLARDETRLKPNSETASRVA